MVVEEVGEFREGASDVAGADNEEDGLGLDHLEVNGRCIRKGALGEAVGARVDGLGGVAAERLGGAGGHEIV